MSRVLGHLNELRASLDAFHDDDYPGETCRIRDLFLVVLYHCKQRLDSLAVSADVNDATDYQTFPAIRAIDTDLQHLFSYLRYLRATSAGQTPPAVQFAATQLIDSYFPAPSNGTPLCIVRPQWRYNLEYAALGRVFANILQRPYLDPGQVFVGKTPVDVLRLAWQQWYAAEVNTSSDRDKDRARAPEQVGILSFSGLDTNDPFSLPILAHELGHFIDDSYPSSLSQAIYETVKIPIKDVRAIFFATDGKHTDLVIGETHDRLLGRLRRTVAELLADRLAARMAGIAYFMAQAERLSSSSEAAGPKIMYQDGGYPGTHLRLTRILDHITSTIHPGNVITFFESAPAAYRSLAQQVLAYLAAWKNLTKDFHLSASLKPIHDRLEERLGVAVAAAEPLIDAAAVKAIPGDVANALTHRFYRRIEALRTNLPPLLEGDQPNCFGEILAAAWVYQLVFGSEKEHALQVAGHVEEARKEEDKIFRLVYKALELVSATRRRHLVSHQPLRVPDAPTTATLQSTPKERLVGLLSGPEIERRQRDHLPLGERLFVVPRFDKVIQGSSLEIHIGHWFTATKRSQSPSIEIGLDGDIIGSDRRDDNAFVRFGRAFAIHPGDFVRGITLEFVGLPADVSASVEGRSTLARQGLLIAGATTVAPGFHGCLVLELTNIGTVPIHVRPGTKVGQLVFQTLTDPLPESLLYRGRYFCQTRPS